MVFDHPERELGTSAFSVIINDGCSGYEGVSLIVVFLTIYLWLFRNEFWFPKVLIVFPIAIVAIWVFNIFRIIAAIAIGDAVSPEIAMAGFHSNTGWIAFIPVSLGAIALLHRNRGFALKANGDALLHTPSRRGWSSPEALLLPFVVLLAATLATDAFSSTFN